MQVKVQRESLVNALTQTKEPNVNIMGVTLRRAMLLQALKINNQDNIVALEYGNLSWDRQNKGENFIDAVKSAPCLQVSLNHTTMRFLNYPDPRNPFSVAALNILTESAPETAGTGINIQEFLPALQKAMVYAATEQTRPILCCVRFEFSGTKLSLIAADGFRLGIFKLPCAVKSKPFLIDTSDLVKVCQLMRAAKPDGFGQGKTYTYPDIYMSQNKDSVTFTCQYASVKCLKVSGNYPQYDQLIPKEGTQIKIIASQMLEAVQNVSIMARDGEGIIRLTFTGQEGQISARSEELGDTIVKIAAIAQADCKVAANGRYLIDTLKQIPAPKPVKVISSRVGKGILKYPPEKPIDMFITNKKSPIRFEWPDSTSIIMPMFVQW